jgi:hypothetical protein
MSFKKIIVILLHAFVGWALCAATMGIGMAATNLQTALLVHAIGAPIYFGVVSYIYFSRFGYTRPLPTAVIFVAFVMLVDFLVVALLINQSLSMFESVLGTWIPFALIFGSTFITGTIVSPSRKTSLK